MIQAWAGQVGNSVQITAWHQAHLVSCLGPGVDKLDEALTCRWLLDQTPRKVLDGT